MDGHSKQEAERAERMFKQRGRLYHADLEIKFEEASHKQGVLQCEIFNTGETMFCKHWNKNLEAINGYNMQHYLKIQHAFSFSDTSTQLGVLIGTLKTMDKNCSNLILFVISFLELLPELLYVLRYSAASITRSILRCVPDVLPMEVAKLLSKKIGEMAKT